MESCTVFANTARNDCTNCVGYTQKDMVAGNNATGASFVNTSGGPIDLTDIKMTGYVREDYEFGSIWMQQLSADGGTIEGSAFQWFDDEDNGQGWWDMDNSQIVEPGEVTLPAGTGLWLESFDNTVKLESAGQVLQAGIDVNLCAGNTLVVNPYPVAVTLNRLAAGGKFMAIAGYIKDEYEFGSVWMQQLNAEGGTVEGSAFQWFDDEDNGCGWWDMDNSLIVEDDDVKLDAGIAVWIEATSEDEKISFPALTISK